MAVRDEAILHEVVAVSFDGFNIRLRSVRGGSTVALPPDAWTALLAFVEGLADPMFPLPDVEPTRNVCPICSCEGENV